MYTTPSVFTAEATTIPLHPVLRTIHNSGRKDIHTHHCWVPNFLDTKVDHNWDMDLR